MVIWHWANSSEIWLTEDHTCNAAAKLVTRQSIDWDRSKMALMAPRAGARCGVGDTSSAGPSAVSCS